MRIALLSSGGWWANQGSCEPQKMVVSLLYEGLINQGVDVTLFGNHPSNAKESPQNPLLKTEEHGNGICSHSTTLNSLARACLHLASLLEKAGEFDLIHNYCDFMPLSYSRLISTPMVTTICDLSSLDMPVLQEYGNRGYYVSTCAAGRAPSLNYISTVYHGIDLKSYTFRKSGGSYLVCLNAIQPDNGVEEAMEMSRSFGMKIILAGALLDRVYFDKQIAPHLDNSRAIYQETTDQPSRNRLLGGAYALLHTANSGEYFDLSIIESLACGTPVVAFPDVVMTEFVKHGETGYLINGVGDAQSTLKQIPALDRNLCRQWAEERFSKERMVHDYLAAYGKILELERPMARHANPPWGRWEVLLDETTYKVKRVTVLPGKRLSYQKHTKRNEHWSVISGKALVTLDGNEILLEEGQALDIPKEIAHRVLNPGIIPLVFIEIQRGSYLGEDDIVRMEDDYGRS